MVVLVSLLSLFIVLAMCAIGVRLLAGRIHGHGRTDLDRELHDLTDDRCFECKGSGATRHLGELRPCEVCEGTGIINATF